MSRNAVHTSVSLVLIGQFEPNKFDPQSLVEARVIGKKSAETASWLTLVPDKTLQFRIQWAEFLIMEDRLQIVALESPYIRICDAAIKAVVDLAPRTLVRQFGINVSCDYDMESVDSRNDLGCRVAPPEAWGRWGDRLRTSMTGETRGGRLQGGVVNVTMREHFDTPGLISFRDVSIRPSITIPQTGVLLHSNHHHQIDASYENSEETDIERKMSEAEVSSFLLSKLSDEFEQSVQEALSIFDNVVALS